MLRTLEQVIDYCMLQSLASQTNTLPKIENLTSAEINIFVRTSLPFHTPATPVGIIMVGGPGSGKSGSQKKTIELIGENENSFVKLDPDRVLSTLFDNNNERYPDVGEVLIKLKEVALQEKKNIVFDFTGRDFLRSRLFVKELLQNGYRVVACITKLGSDTAIARAKQRALREGRKVESEYLMATYAQLNALIPHYVTYKEFHDVFVFDNNGSSLVNLLSFNRHMAADVVPGLTQDFLSRQEYQVFSSVSLYGNAGILEEVVLPVRIMNEQSGQIKFMYSETGLPDWILTVDKNNKTVTQQDGAAFAYDSIPSLRDSSLRIHIRIPRDEVYHIPSLPQRSSDYWTGRKDDAITLKYGFSGELPELARVRNIFGVKLLKPF